MIDKANVGGTVHEINDTGARGMISPDVFSTASNYEAGEYCIYNNTLYNFTEAKSSGAWDDSKASATDIASELSSLNSSLNIQTYEQNGSFVESVASGFTISAYRVGKIVFLTGQIVGGNFAAGTTAKVAQLVSLKPINSVGIVAPHSGGSTTCLLTIGSNGEINVNPDSQSAYYRWSTVYMTDDFD